MNIDLRVAQLAIAKAEAKAGAMGVPSSFAILSPGRELIAFAKMDGALPCTAEVAVAKAQTALSFRTGTGTLQPLFQPGAPFFGLDKQMSHPIISFHGGLPVTLGTHCVGALGVSGGTADDDLTLAQHMIDVLQEQLSGKDEAARI